MTAAVSIRPDAGGGLPPQRQRAALLLAQGLAPLAVAEQLGVTTRTLRRWREDPPFRALVDQHLQDAVGQARDQLMAALPVAIAGLVELAQDRDNPAVRLGACNSLMRVWTRQIHEQRLEDEVADLEAGVVAIQQQLLEQRQAGWAA